MSASTSTSRAWAAVPARNEEAADDQAPHASAGRGAPIRRAATGWRLPFALAGALALVGGPMHPEATDGASLQEGLAEMTAETSRWAVGHGLLAVAAVLVVTGLASARRRGSWPAVASVLPFAIVAASVYAVEAALHAAAVVDHDRLTAGEWPVVTVAHLVAAVIGYPLYGLALGALALRALPTWPVPLRAVSVAGMIGAAATALAAPLTVLGVDGANVLFPVAGTTTAVWLLVAGILGRRGAAGASARGRGRR